MQNDLMSLNNHLFAELERLGDEEMSVDLLEKEIERAKAITAVATQVIANGALALKAKIAVSESLSRDIALPKMLEG